MDLVGGKMKRVGDNMKRAGDYMRWVGDKMKLVSRMQHKILQLPEFFSNHITMCKIINAITVSC